MYVLCPFSKGAKEPMKSTINNVFSQNQLEIEQNLICADCLFQKYPNSMACTVYTLGVDPEI